MSNLPPIPAPPTSLAEASTSLQALWDYMQPAFDHIFRSPTSDPAKVPPIDAAYYIWVSTALYNYRTSPRRPASLNENARMRMPGSDVYERVDAYLASIAQELMSGAPQDAHALIPYLLSTYTRFTTSAAVLHRMLNYINSHFVTPELNRGHGWLGRHEIPDQNPKKPRRGGNWREGVKARFAELRAAELKKWGWEEGDPADVLAEAQTCAEAASGLDRVVPLASLARRRFRTEVLEPLLKVPGAGAGMEQSGNGRLDNAVAELLDLTTTQSLGERAQLAQIMARMLRMCGMQPDHPLRRRLDSDGYTGMSPKRYPTVSC
ncbi:hypothetical protein DENSPDRAFT_871763 [Dentipellis sp. KUC8613]|nr:hypothetical protein DENSPDRAFT_871763 [Dentipellis sp. KUC8613]